jgi:hypothetical protein
MLAWTASVAGYCYLYWPASAQAAHNPALLERCHPARMGAPFLTGYRVALLTTWCILNCERRSFDAIRRILLSRFLDASLHAAFVCCRKPGTAAVQSECAVPEAAKPIAMMLKMLAYDIMTVARND